MNGHLPAEESLNLAAFEHVNKYRTGDSIDWLEEASNARARTKDLRSGRGLQRLSALAIDSSILWIVVIVTGVGIGVLGGWMDILVAWLGDLRIGRCQFNLLYNMNTCCKGYDVGEPCHEWKTWGDYFGIRYIGLQALFQTFTYVVLSMAFAGCAALFVRIYAPFAFHTGIPEIKAILAGFVFDDFLSPWTLLIKAVGLVLSVASGLSLGKEGPLVHISCCIAFLAATRFRQFRENEAEKRDILAAAAAAGVSVAFGSPLGGVLFALEELDAYHEDIMWRSFVTSVIAAVSLQYIDPYGTSKLVLFQITTSNDGWRFFELIPWSILGILGGVIGIGLIKLNTKIAIFRERSWLKEWPILEVLVASGITASISYMVVFLRVPTSELVQNLFLECDGSSGYHGLCNPEAVSENVFLLLTTAIIKIGLTAWSFGMMVPAGIFLPTIATGACIGRAFGLVFQSFHRSYPDLFLFSACPPDPTVRCISPGFYAVIGAAALLAGVTRMTISLVVILFELTGALSHVLPIMIVVMVAKWVADSFNIGGIYSVWLAMRRYIWLPQTEFRDSGRKCAEYMRPLHELAIVDNQGCTVRSLESFVAKQDVHGYPVTEGEILVGYVQRRKVCDALVYFHLGNTAVDLDVPCTFTRRESFDGMDWSSLVETPALHLRKDAPLELAVSIFQKMNTPYVLFSEEGKLAGMMNKSDIMNLLFSTVEIGTLPNLAFEDKGKTRA